MTGLRALAGILVGLGLFRLLVAVLETTLVGAVADGPITSEAEFFAVRNRPVILAAALGYNSLAAFLAGYLVAKVSRARSLKPAVIAAAIQTAALVWGFTASEYAPFTPVWTRIALVALTGPAMLAGASVHVGAARVPEHEEN
jgi:hypothetical protein